MSFFVRIGKRISSSQPATYIVRKSKVTYVPGFKGISLFDVVGFFFKQVKAVGMTERASSIAFNFVMAIPPAIIFLFTLIPYLPISRDFEQTLYVLIRDVIPGERNNAALINFLHDFINEPRNELLSLGFILSLYFSSNAVMGIMRSFDKNYIGFRKRKFLQARLEALRLTLILFILVLVSVLLLMMQGQVLDWLGVEDRFVRALIRDARWIVIILLFFYSISFIYRHAPAVHKKWPHLTPGSVLATFLMILFTFGFSYWVNNFGNYNELYGSIGTILFFMLLVYFNSLVLLIGFELNVSITSLKKLADERVNKVSEGNGNPGEIPEI
ncbi:MAG TPA: YihY/virulence factor BrkB family protein [Chitinophagaceae bacterium]|nr:YihY/virulence factor BrkB family protein [Chitinophagaceae bacterium]